MMTLLVEFYLEPARKLEFSRGAVSNNPNPHLHGGGSILIVISRLPPTTQLDFSHQSQLVFYRLSFFFFSRQPHLIVYLVPAGAAATRD